MFTEVFSHIHPIVVHFPIALIIIGILYDVVLSIRKRSIQPTQGLYIWLLAAVGAMVAVATGPDEDARGVTNLIHTHSTFADLTMWLTIILVLSRLYFVWKKNSLMGKVLIPYLALAIITGGTVLTTGYYGGKMVYDQGIGVQVNGKSVNPPKSFHHPQP